MSSPSEEIQKAAVTGVSMIRKEMTETMEAVSKMAERSSSTTLLSLGGGLLLIAFAIKVWGNLAQHAVLSPVEFVAVLVVGTILLLAGAAIRVYQSDKQHDAGNEIRASGVKLVAKGMEIGADLAKNPPTGPN